MILRMKKNVPKSDPERSDEDSYFERLRRRKNRASLVSLLVLLLVVATLYYEARIGEMLADESVSGASPSVAAAAETPTPAVIDDSGLLVSFLDVGQGDCILLESPSGKTMLVDAGPNGMFDTIDAYLKQEGVVGLDVVVASHLHEDHIGSMPEIVDTYPIGTFYYPPFDSESGEYNELLDALQENDVAVSSPYASATSLIPWDDAVEVRILAPYEVVYDDFNDTSYMLNVTYGDTSVLLTGDAETVSEKLALKALPNHYFQADVLKVGHHGSSSSTSEKFLEAVNPSVAVISVGADNQYGLPDEEVLDRLTAQGIRVLRTDEDGTIRILLDGTDVRVLE